MPCVPSTLVIAVKDFCSRATLLDSFYFVSYSLSVNVGEKKRIVFVSVCPSFPTFLPWSRRKHAWQNPLIWKYGLKMDAATNACLGFRNFAGQLFSEYLWTTASVFPKNFFNSFIEKSINLLFSVISLNPLMAGDNKNSYVLKQTGSFWMQVCLRKYDLLLSQDIKRVKFMGLLDCLHQSFCEPLFRKKLICFRNQQRNFISISSFWPNTSL